MNTGIPQLFMDTRVGTSDDWSFNNYGYHRPQPYPHIPLSLELVMNGQSFRSTAPLFQFPLEVLTLIVEQVPSQCLKSLALVNSDCRQLARSRQFANIHIGCNKPGWSLLKILHQEHQEHLDKQSSTDKTNPLVNSRYTLGTCIRRISFALVQQLDLSRHTDQNTAMSSVETRFDLSAFEARITNSYRELIKTILIGGYALPHLEVIHWGEANPAIDRGMLTSFAASNVKHFKVTSFPFSVSGIKQWPLRTLILSLRVPTHWAQDDPETTVPDLSLLSLCASTLETLFWMCPCTGGFDISGLSFPKLRHLDLATAAANELPLQALFDAPLKALVLRSKPDGPNDAIMRALLKQGSIETLRELVWTNYTPVHSQLVPFLKENSQITKLSMAGRASKDFLGVVLPVLNQFTKLKSLRLGSMENKLPESFVEAISKITSLEQLCLSGTTAAPATSLDPVWHRQRPEWYVDHASMRSHLCNLRHLRILAIINDTYLPMHNDFGSVVDANEFSYYESRWPGMDFLNSLEIGDVKRYDLLWERQHRGRTIDEATKYAKVMPKLEWIYVGQYQMGIKLVGDTRLAATFTEDGWPPRYDRRALPGRFLERTFGWEGSWKCFEERGRSWSPEMWT